MKLSRILVPVDASDTSRRALQFAANLAEEMGSKLDVLHVTYFTSETDAQEESWLPDAISNDPAVKEQAKPGFPRMGGETVSTDLALPVEWYSLVPVTVERNHGLEPENFKPHFPERTAPYRVYDCFRPFDGTLDVGVGDGRKPDTAIGGLYAAIVVPADAEPGEYKASVTITAGETTLNTAVSDSIQSRYTGRKPDHHPGLQHRSGNPVSRCGIRHRRILCP